MSDQQPTQSITIAQLRTITGAQAGEIEALVRSRAISVRDGKTGLVGGIRAYLDQVRSKAKAASLTVAVSASRDARTEADEQLVSIADRVLIPEADAGDAVAVLAASINTSFSTIPIQVTRVITERRAIDLALRAAQSAFAASLRDLQEFPEPATHRPTAPKKRKAT